jgi:predicted nucleotide-binding protein
MTKHPSTTQPQAPRLTPAAAIRRLQSRLREIAEIDPSIVKDRSDPQIRALEISIDEALSAAFGHDTTEYRRYVSATNLNPSPLTMGRKPSSLELIEGIVQGKDRAKALLTQAVRSLEERLAELGETTQPEQSVATDSTPSNDIFIVHGRDELAKQEVARVIERAGLNAVILHEQANAGRTIIEKFEDHGRRAGFAVVILTPDDVGGPYNGELQPRARQNVIGEMFWFAGRLGRKHVCALKKGNVEMPSDFAGVGYTDMDDRGAWKAELLRELQTAGYAVDWAKALA